MKNLYFLVVAGCMVFSQVHADTVLPYAHAKSQNDAHYLSAFWSKAQIGHAFVDAFSDSMAVLMINESEPAALLKNVANTNDIGAEPSASVLASRSIVTPSRP